MKIVLTLVCLTLAVNAELKMFKKNDLIKAVDKGDVEKVREILTENPMLADVRDKVRVYDDDVFEFSSIYTQFSLFQ